MGEFQQDIPVQKLLEMYSGMIYRIAYLRTHNRTDAEDITQEVFLKYITADKKFNGEEHRKAWLLRVAVNCTNSFVTSAHYRHRASLEDIPEQITEIAEKLTYEQRLALAEAIGSAAETSLAQELAEVYYMAVFEDGSVLKFTIGAVEGKFFEM